MPDQNLQEKHLIALSELIAKVKEDLLTEVRKNGEQDPLLFVDEIEVSAQVVASKEEGGKAGLKLSILSFGAEAGVNSQTGNEYVQTVKIKLSPLVSKKEYMESLSLEERMQLFAGAKRGLVRGENQPDSLDMA